MLDHGVLTPGAPLMGLIDKIPQEECDVNNLLTLGPLPPD